MRDLGILCLSDIANLMEGRAVEPTRLRLLPTACGSAPTSVRLGFVPKTKTVIAHDVSLADTYMDPTTSRRYGVALFR